VRRVGTSMLTLLSPVNDGPEGTSNQPDYQHQNEKVRELHSPNTEARSLASKSGKERSPCSCQYFLPTLRFKAFTKASRLRSLSSVANSLDRKSVPIIHDKPPM
jgi:hypothetical protein